MKKSFEAKVVMEALKDEEVWPSSSRNSLAEVFDNKGKS
jgi:hypothetical protein